MYTIMNDATQAAEFGKDPLVSSGLKRRNNNGFPKGGKGESHSSYNKNNTLTCIFLLFRIKSFIQIAYLFSVNTENILLRNTIHVCYKIYQI